MNATKDLAIRKGATFAQTLRWEAPPNRPERQRSRDPGPAQRLRGETA